MTAETGQPCTALVQGPDGIPNESAGEPFEIKKAVCLHEEDAGIVWKHTELRTMHPETRRSRRLVISTMATVGALPHLISMHDCSLSAMLPRLLRAHCVTAVTGVHFPGLTVLCAAAANYEYGFNWYFG